MRRSSLNLYLQKVAEGDQGYLDRLCAQLSERLVYVARTESSNSASGVTTVRIVQRRDGPRVLIPTFTSLDAIKDWIASNEPSATSFDLLGADLCALLDGKTWLSIDPGSEHAVELQPALLKRIAAGDEPAAETADAPPPPPQPPAPQQQPDPEPPAAPPLAENPGDKTVVLDKDTLEFIGREPQTMTESGTFMIRKQVADRSVPIVRSSKVLADEEVQEKPKQKKRSFLGFLKGQK